MAKDGSFTVVWTDSTLNGGGQGIAGQRYDNTGAAVGSNFLISDTTDNNQTYPGVGISDSGTHIFSWQSSGQDEPGLNYYGIYAKFF